VVSKKDAIQNSEATFVSLSRSIERQNIPMKYLRHLAIPLVRYLDKGQQHIVSQIGVSDLLTTKIRESLFSRGGRSVGMLAQGVLSYLILSAARGLVGLHMAGRTHGDPKPDNLILVRYGDKLTGNLNHSLKWIDFGLSAEINVKGVPKGSPGFAAPEVIGEIATGKKVLYTPKTDSFGMMMSMVVVFTATSITDRWVGVAKSQCKKGASSNERQAAFDRAYQDQIESMLDTFKSDANRTGLGKSVVKLVRKSLLLSPKKRWGPKRIIRESERILKEALGKDPKMAQWIQEVFQDVSPSKTLLSSLLSEKGSDQSS
ncbi:MAG: serine/threonine protein kinase, partial [Candidatus Marinamargulisbacteria bacterium]